jgi:plasmid stabilization system protein ParE
MAVYELSPEVEDDLFEIWSFIAQDDPAAADRVEDELRLTFES